MGAQFSKVKTVTKRQLESGAFGHILSTTVLAGSISAAIGSAENADQFLWPGALQCSCCGLLCCCGIIIACLPGVQPS